LQVLALDRAILHFIKREDAIRLLVLAYTSLQYSGQWPCHWISELAQFISVTVPLDQWAGTVHFSDRATGSVDWHSSFQWPCHWISRLAQFISVTVPLDQSAGTVHFSDRATGSVDWHSSFQWPCHWISRLAQFISEL